MIYALTLNENSRILFASIIEYDDPNKIVVTELPEGDITNYRYINRTYVLDQEEVARKEAEKQAFEKQLQIDAYVKELESYDYIGTKIAMGVATKEDYAEEIAYTETIRQKIRELESGDSDVPDA